MKKFLAILLSVIMLFTLGVAAFAEGEGTEEPKGMPSDVAKQPGKVVFSIENTYIEPSKEYSIPLVMKSDYLDKVPADAETFYFYLASIYSTSSYVTIKNIRFADDVAQSNRISIKQVGEEDGAIIFKLEKADFNKFFATSDEGIVIAYIDVATTEDVPEEYDVDFGNIYFDLFGELYQEDEEGNSIGAISNPDAIGYSVGYVDAEGNFTGFTCTLDISVDDFNADTACFYHAPKVPTWQERLTEWAKGQALLFVRFFLVVFEALEQILMK